MDPSLFSDGNFWKQTDGLFASMTPEWSSWSDVFQLASTAQSKSFLQGAMGSFFLTNLVSNMLFAGMNFVQGFGTPNLSFTHGLFNVEVNDFAQEPSNPGCATLGASLLPFCIWPEVKPNEQLGLTSFQDYIKSEFSASLPAHTFFEAIFTGKQVPSWEDDKGRQETFKFLQEGMKVARAQGFEPMQTVRANWDSRFAFDAEGLLSLQQEGFGFFRGREVKYASNGASGVALVERLLEKHGAGNDVLGVLMTDSVLSMHLTHDSETEEFEVDLTALEKYMPLPGFAKLGGRAVFKETEGRLATVLLEYGGHKYGEFNDSAVEEDYSSSKLSGWRFAEKAIIASLLAKTQLLLHFKTIHLELAPVLQAVTVDAFASNPLHPLRRLLEPFISRNVQATASNMQLWFQFRVGEFGLAPLPIEDQLKLLHEIMESSPLNLADLDMERFAKARGMEEFSKEGREAGAWNWTWHQRASKVEDTLDELVDCWLSKHYEGDDDKLASDPEFAAWWKSLVTHMPALRVATLTDKTWVATLARSTTPTTTLVPLPAFVETFGESSAEAAPDAWATPNFGNPFVPTTKVIEQLAPPTTSAAPPPMQAATAAPASPWSWSLSAPAPAAAAPVAPATPSAPATAAAAAAAGATTAEPPFFSILSMHPPPAAAAAPLAAAATDVPHLATQVPDEAASLWRRLQGDASDGAASATSAEAAALPDVASLRRVLRTLMLWVSWVHEDVGHSTAAFVYNPMHTPMFVPEDGIGVPLAPLAVVTAAYRNFVFLERAKVLGEAPMQWFEQKQCKRSFFFMKKCNQPVDDKKCYDDYQQALKTLATSSDAFSACDERGFYSCVGRVETSASS
mmetsp:Transcript_83213/g.211887  ORF Transcript_83213/g.211887 Transcript_83213/m.211887 type:complete len:851 (-) Transcript_83213:67-2619(-)